MNSEDRWIPITLSRPASADELFFEIGFRRSRRRETVVLHFKTLCALEMNRPDRLFFIFSVDKQQELDIPSLRLDEDEGRPTAKAASSAGASTSSSQSGSQSKKKDVKSKVTPMSHISGVKRALSHTNSFTGERLPKYGVETLKEDDLGHVSAGKRVRIIR